MPMPWTYRHADKEWRALLNDAKEWMSLDSDNMTYTAIDAVFQVFRRRLTAQEGPDFASVLPSVPRAIFVHGWRIADTPDPFEDRATMTREAKRVRMKHNLTPDNAIEAVAWALRRSIDQRDLDRVLKRLGPVAHAFWRVDVDDPAELAQRIIWRSTKCTCRTSFSKSCSGDVKDRWSIGPQRNGSPPPRRHVHGTVLADPGSIRRHSVVEQSHERGVLRRGIARPPDDPIVQSAGPDREPRPWRAA